MSRMFLNDSTKKADSFISAYKNSSVSRLCEVYGSYSMRKVEAYNQCVRKMWDMNGRDFRILSYNTNFFTVGWLSVDGYLCVETPANSYAMRYFK